MIYMLSDEKRNGTLFKVGATHDINKRLLQYCTHNAGFKLISTCETYKKTKFRLEKTVQAEIRSMGYTFELSKFGKKETEWFFVDKEHEQYFLTAGLTAFKACKGRKITMIQ